MLRMISINGSVLGVLAVIVIFIANVRAADWQEVQQIKKQLLAKAAVHAMEQQKKDAAEPISIIVSDVTVRGMSARRQTDGDGSILIEAMAQPSERNTPATVWCRIKLPEPIDMIDRHSGLAMTINSFTSTSPEVRLGVRLIGVDENQQAVITPIIPIVSQRRENPRDIYFDWSLINYANADDAVAVLKKVTAIELTLGSIKRAPQRGPSDAPQPAKFKLSNIRVVDYRKGSYDLSRNTWRQTSKTDLTLQHRVQEVTGLVALYGGEAGILSAINSLDMCARTQCWDGSFLDGRRGARTVASGEYTFGFTIYGTLSGYIALEDINAPALDEIITIGPTTMTRRAFYQQMFYRAAMARTAARPREYRDDIIGGDTLMAGANRVLGYAIAMRMVADVLTDDKQRLEVLDAYGPTIQQIVDQQGAYSGGFPLLGEGNRFDGKGIHYDGGYIRTHMDWLIVGVRRTGDPLLLKMLERYQTVFEAVMNKQGKGLKPMISERSSKKRSDTQLILPDATAQVGLQYNLPIIAQWGYNVGTPVWDAYDGSPANHFTSMARARGYSLGAFSGRLVDDMQTDPQPRDLGYLFPRQYPIWSSQLFTKDGKLARTSRVTVHPDGTMVNDFQIEVGQYPKTVGVPVWIESPEGPVTIEAVSLTGWPSLLPADANLKIITITQASIQINQPLAMTLHEPTRIIIEGPPVILPDEAGGKKVVFRAELIATPSKPNLAIKLTVLNGTMPYEHVIEPTMSE